MSFKCKGIELGKWKALWSTIYPKLSTEISIAFKHHLEFIFSSENDEDRIVSLINFIQCCCEHIPSNFEEYVAYVMITISIELLSIPSILLRAQKMQLIAHTFGTNVEFWSNDQEKVMTVAEAIWKVSSNALELNRILIAIHGYNQYTFNVSMILLLAALGSLTLSEQSDKLPLMEADAIYTKIESLDIHERNAKQTLFDFLCLFQSYQRLISLQASKDESLSTIICLKPKQLQKLEEYLKMATRILNKTIRDQEDLNENTAIVHLIELVNTHMDSVRQHAEAL